MKLKRYRLEFTAPLHISSGGFGLESADSFIHSDTLYSAISVMAVDLLGEKTAKEMFLDPASQHLALSSAFPWREDVFFFPRPLSLFAGWNKKEEAEVDFNKRWRQTRFISEELLRQALPGGKVFLKKEMFGAYYNNNCLSHKKLDNFIDNVEIPRVVLDRVSNNANIFHFAQVSFAQRAGLFFLARFASDDVERAFESVLRSLGDEGIGGERSSGKGSFKEPVSEGFSEPVLENPNGFLNLSLYIPAENEIGRIDFQKSNYRLLNRRGWINRHTARRKTRRVFTEGSVLRFSGEPFEARGELEKMFSKGDFDLHHDVFRSWQTIAFPMNMTSAPGTQNH